MTIIDGADFDAYWSDRAAPSDETQVTAVVTEIIEAVRREGDGAVRRFTAKFDRCSPRTPEIPRVAAEAAWEGLRHAEPELAAALELAAAHIRNFAERQRAQITDFEYEIAPGLFTGQRVIPVERAAIYVPGGRFPLISSVLMGVIPAVTAGAGEVLLVSPPGADGFPDRRILGAACLAGVNRIFAVGGAQAVAALALGTETIPRVDVIAGPGNKYVAAAKRLLFGAVGIDLIAGPTDVLVITDEPASGAAEAAADLTAADMLAQAEHDPDARARVLVPSREAANRIAAALERRLAALPAAAGDRARPSLDAGGLMVVYDTREGAIRIANRIAPEHLELQVAEPSLWMGALENYGSLFIGSLAAEVLGDYSAGINHTLPTAGSARFTGGLSVRHFLKTPTTLRCGAGTGYDEARAAAERIARAEGLFSHAASAASRARDRG
ncbi:MAG: histidinol dehydrogenase [Spirochaetaceae bacterium]|jgi:histidinol dehydrogenase|nr:histidinol dehydrogenase [Spirochaetaceae bacterium]